MRLAQIKGGVVTNIGEFDPADIPDWAEGWVETATAGPGWTWDGETFAPPGAPGPTAAEVNAERDRRVVRGTTIEVPDHGPIRTEGRDVDARNLQGLVTAAQLRIAAGDTTTLTPFRDADDTIHELTPLQIVALWQGGAAYVSACFQAAWTLKDRPEGIPEDFTAGEWWP